MVLIMLTAIVVYLVISMDAIIGLSIRLLVPGNCPGEWAENCTRIALVHFALKVSLDSFWRLIFG